MKLLFEFECMIDALMCKVRLLNYFIVELKFYAAFQVRCKACTRWNLTEINMVKLSIVVSAHIASLIKEAVQLTTKQRVFVVLTVLYSSA